MVRKLLIAIIAIVATMSLYNNAQAESLFALSTSQNYNASPKSLFAGVRAMGIGDLISIKIEESLRTTDTMAYNSDKSSNTVENSTATTRNLAFGDTISTQVVQMLSNGNMMVQGKKTLVNNNERVDLIVTGVVDPRWIDQNGQISSTKVANLQFALSGRGSLSRGQNEGVINRVIKYLF